LQDDVVARFNQIKKYKGCIMLLKNTSKSISTLILSTLLSTAFMQKVCADDTDESHKISQKIEPIVYLIKFDITGNYSGAPYGSPVFTIAGPGYSTVNTRSGEILDIKLPWRQVASLSNAQITFVLPHEGDPAYVSRFTCLTANGGCRVELKDGSVLVADPEVSLDGRLVGGMDPTTGMPSPWGFVANDKYDPATGIFPQRILGCGGLRGVEGPLTGTVGSICFNGTFNVPVTPTGIDISRPLTGGSNCTIALHHPTIPGQ
jgi:hypothetical protein